MRGRLPLLFWCAMCCGSQWEAVLTTEDTLPLLLAYRQPIDPDIHYAWVWPGRPVRFGDPTSPTPPQWAMIAHMLCDVTFDGTVNVADLQRFVAAYGSADGLCDFNTDGTVNAGDLQILVDNWSR